jgi:cysteine-S-conjugate beta-lyase
MSVCKDDHREEGLREESEDAMRSILIHGGIDGDERTGAVSVPIYQTSTYRQDGIGGMRSGYEYSRSGNPTREALEKLIAELEGGKAGFAFASGLAALTAVLFLFKSGDKILLSHNAYGGTFRLLDKVFKGLGLSFDLVDASKLDSLAHEISPDVRALILESPTNPLLEVTDIAAASAIAKSKGVLTIVDNTFMTPYLQRPLALGADIVVHSATKYLGGHSDLIAGLAVTADEGLAERLKFIQNASGGILQPFDSWLLIRGIKTLAVRMDAHVANAEFIASRLSGHKGVSRVYYPGLPDFKGRDINLRQARSGGAIIAFELAEDFDVLAFSRAVKMIVFGESLGGVESILTHPATMTHASIPEDIRARVGITDRLLRLSVGIEDASDILRDLERAFDAAKAPALARSLSGGDR